MANSNLNPGTTLNKLSQATEIVVGLAQENLFTTILLLGVFVFLFLLLRFVHSYGRLKKLKFETDKSWENLQVLLTQRNNEVPKLLKICRDTFKKEDHTDMEKVVSARKHITVATRSNDIGKLGIAEAMLRKELRNTLVKAKEYPDLIATQDFKMIKARLNGYNNAIGDRRTLYNTNAKEINDRLSKRTGNMAAGILDVVEREEFKVQVEQLGTNDLSTLFAS